MNTSLSRYDRIDPMRPSAFRWARAQRLFLHDEPLNPRRDDQLTARVLDYQHTIQGTALPSKCPAPRFRSLHKAHRIYTENTELRWELEARLLAAQSDRQIAHAIGLSRGLIALYHNIFLACRDRLSASDTILVTFIGPGPSAGFAPGDMSGIWKWVGYFAGPHVLETIIAATSKQTRQHSYTGEVLESARRFVLMAQIPVTIRPSSLLAVIEMVGERERSMDHAYGSRRMTMDETVAVWNTPNAGVVTNDPIPVV
jgi:hypothetical protein